MELLIRSTAVFLLFIVAASAQEGKRRKDPFALEIYSQTFDDPCDNFGYYPTDCRPESMDYAFNAIKPKVATLLANFTARLSTIAPPVLARVALNAASPYPLGSLRSTESNIQRALRSPNQTQRRIVVKYLKYCWGLSNVERNEQVLTGQTGRHAWITPSSSLTTKLTDLRTTAARALACHLNCISTTKSLALPDAMSLSRTLFPPSNSFEHHGQAISLLRDLSNLLDTMQDLYEEM